MSGFTLSMCVEFSLTMLSQAGVCSLFFPIYPGQDLTGCTYLLPTL
jgi:hypothetical protein